jgi:TetR/AcrR family transcriptional regulator
MADKKRSTPKDSGEPRRSPGVNRQRDAERARRLLLEAALDEFAAKGFAGARTEDIAAKAGVNKQLITYYFGGKEGLYEAVGEQWFALERNFVKPGVPFEELIDAYALNIDHRMARLLIWEGLRPTRAAEDDTLEITEDESVADIRARQQAGEIAANLDPRFLALAVMGALMAPIAMPQLARRATGLDPESSEFMNEYRTLLQQLVQRLK